MMLIANMHEIGLKLLTIRKSHGFTQSEAAEKSGLSDRTYADIERGTVNMRVETLLKLCHTFNITPNELLTTFDPLVYQQEQLFLQITKLSKKERKTAIKLLQVYIDSLRQ